MKLAVAYTRVSSTEQLREGFSVPVQKSLAERYAESNGLSIAAHFSADESGGTRKARGEFARMVMYLRANPQVRIVLVEKVDRLYRNHRDYVTLDELGVEIHFIKLNIVVGAGARSNDLLQHDIQLALARHYLANLSEEVKKGMKRKCEEGGYPSWAPVGYLNVKDAIEKKRSGGLALDPVKAPLVREIFEAAATGSYNLGDLCRLAARLDLRGRCGARIGMTQMVKILKCRVYTGRFAWSGVEYRGNYEPLISDEVFDKVQATLGRSSRARARTNAFAYSGAVRCTAHGRLLTGDIKKGRFVYYFCRPCGLWYPEKRFDAAVSSALRSLALNEAVSEFILDALSRWHHNSTERERSRATWVKKRLSELQRLSDAAYEDKLTGVLDEQTWRERDHRWRAERQRLQAESSALAPTIERADFMKRASSQFELAKVAADQYLAQDRHQKARLLRAFCSNLRVEGVNISIEMRSPFDVIAKMAIVHPGWGGCSQFEPLIDEYAAAILALGRAA